MKKCKHCMSEIDENAKICPNCRKGQKSKKKFYIFGFIIFIAILYIWGSIIQTKENVKNSTFNIALSSFKINYLTSCMTLENIANDINSYWHDSIFEKKYDGDINKAIEQALEDNEENIINAKKEKENITKNYNDIRTLECYSNYCDDIKSAVKEAYDIYIDFYSMTTSPSGNYNNYNEKFANIDSNTVKYYNNIDELQNLFNN